jgi:arylsulfatase
VPLRVPKLFNLRTDPYERADVTSNTYYDWLLDNDYLVFASQLIVTQFLATFREFPPRQRAASFSIDQAVEKLRHSSAEHDGGEYRRAQLLERRPNEVCDH